MSSSAQASVECPSIIFLKPQRLIICTDCKFALDPSNEVIRSHRQSEHLEDYDDGCAFFPERILSVAVRHDDEDGLAAAESHGYCEYVSVERNGLKCNHCDYYHPLTQAMTRHVTSNHKDLLRSRRRRYTRGHPISSLFCTRFHYFPVTPPNHRAGYDPDMLRPYNEAWRSLVEDRVPATDNPTPSEATGAWLRHTRWPELLAGDDLLALARLTEVRHPDDPPRFHPTVHEAVTSQAKSWLSLAEKRDPDHLAIFSYPGPSEPRQSFKFVSPLTHDRNAALWTSFVLFMLRLRRRRQGPSLPTALDQAVADLGAVLRVEGSNTLDESRRLIRVITGIVIRHDVEDPVGCCPLSLFLAVRGFDLASKTWKSSAECKPTLTGTLYVIRLASIGLTSDPTVGGAVSFAARYLQPGTPTPFSHVHRLRDFARSLDRRHRVHPTVSWHENGQTVSLKGDQFDLQDVNKVILQLVKEAEELVCRLGFLTRDTFLVHRRPRTVRDDLTWRDNGRSFVDIPDNKHLRRDPREMLDPVRDTTAVLSLCAPIGSETVWSNQGRLQHRQDVRALKRLVVLLLHLTGGLPALGAELCALRYRNTVASQRNVYVHQGLVVAVVGHEQDGRPAFIARYFPLEVSRIVIALIADVIPLDEYIRSTMDLDSNGSPPSAGGSSPYLFDTDGGHPTTVELGDLLQARFRHPARPIRKLSLWRHLAVAIDQRHLLGSFPQALSTAGLNPNLLRSRHIGNGPVDLRDPHGSLRQALTSFLDVAHTWHRFWRLSKADAGRVKAPELSKWCRDAIDRVGRLRVEPTTSATIVDLVTPTPSPKRKRYDDETTPDPRAAAAEAPDPTRPNPPETSARIPQEPSRRQTSEMIATAVARLYPHSGGTLRSGQSRAVPAVLRNACDTLIVLPSGSGKTDVASIPALLEPRSVTILLLPFPQARRDLLRRCADAGVSCARFDPTAVTPDAQVVYLTVDESVTAVFGGFLRDLYRDGRLSRIVVDSCHLYALDPVRRQALGELAWLHGVRVPRVFVTGTLPTVAQDVLTNDVIKPREAIETYRESCARHGISHVVTVAPEPDDLVFHHLRYRATPPTRALLFVTSEVEALAWTERINRSGEHSATRAPGGFPDDGPSPLLVTTPATHADPDAPDISLAISLGPPPGLLAYCGNVGRLGRGDPPRIGTSVLLLTDQQEADLKKKAATRDDPLHVADAAALLNFISTKGCRLGVIGAHLDGSFGTRCRSSALRHGACDNCAGVTAPRFVHVPTILPTASPPGSPPSAPPQPDNLPRGGPDSSPESDLAAWEAICV